MVSDVVSELEGLLSMVPEKLEKFSLLNMITPLAEGKWSRIQILGHLCDSAIHNVSRFIEAPFSPTPFTIVSYNQDCWVSAQHYMEAPVAEILALWISLNRSIVRVVSHIPEGLYAHECKLASGDCVTLEWLIEDYVKHMKHHLKQIFPGFN